MKINSYVRWCSDWWKPLQCKNPTLLFTITQISLNGYNLWKWTETPSSWWHNHHLVMSKFEDTWDDVNISGVASLCVSSVTFSIFTEHLMFYFLKRGWLLEQQLWKELNLCFYCIMLVIFEAIKNLQTLQIKSLKSVCFVFIEINTCIQQRCI